MIQINSTKIPPLRENDRIIGKSSTAFVLMEYGNYHCPSSGKAHSTITKLQQQLGERFCFVFRHFPRLEAHSQSLKAAEAAGTQGKFWEMHSMLFENQKQLEDGNLVEYAAELELDIPLFLKELTSHLHRDRIQEDVDSGIEYGVVQTPTFFIRIRHEGTQNLEVLLVQILGAIS